jgi:ectoine hydroxylase-related dioxygenase (phytanoyl-CoA dioxygenase family)
MVNIYVPLFGSDENSSLKLQPGSHKWNEKDTMVTTGGAYFKHTNKKYSVDAIVSSKVPLDMIRPNPKENQMMIFSPYLIHGCAKNENDTTRFSLEIRFIRKEDTKQEEDFKEFLKTRTWR